MDSFENNLSRLIDKVEGITDETWEDIADDMDLGVSADSIRRSFSSGLFSGYNVAKYYEDKVITGDSEYLEELKDSIYKERVRLQDANREKRNILREEARFENLVECLSSKIDSVNNRERLKDVCIDSKKKEAVVILSDIHYGIIVDNVKNYYDTSVARERLEVWASKVVDYCKSNNVENLRLVLLGDLVSGIIRLQHRVAQEEDVIDQTVEISEIISDIINKFANSVEMVKVYGVIGNHSRVNAQKSDSLPSENFERLIFEYIKLRTGFNVIQNGTEDFVEFTLNDGKKCVATHGDKDSFDKSIERMTKILGHIPDYIYMGHTHHFQSKEEDGTTVIVNGSVISTDDYAMSLRRNTPSSQVMHIHGLDDTIVNIKL